MAAAFALVMMEGTGIGGDLARKRSDHHGGVVEHLDELEETLAAPAVHVPPGAPVLVAQIRDHVHHGPVLGRGEPAFGRAVALEARLERGDLLGVQGLALRQRVQDSLAVRERKLVPTLREPAESGLVCRLPAPRPGDVVRGVGAVDGVRGIGAAVQVDESSPLVEYTVASCSMGYRTWRGSSLKEVDEVRFAAANSDQRALAASTAAPCGCGLFATRCLRSGWTCSWCSSRTRCAAR